MDNYIEHQIVESVRTLIMKFMSQQPRKEKKEIRGLVFSHVCKMFALSDDEKDWLSELIFEMLNNHYH